MLWVLSSSVLNKSIWMTAAGFSPAVQQALPYKWGYHWSHRLDQVHPSDPKKKEQNVMSEDKKMLVGIKIASSKHY